MNHNVTLQINLSPGDIRYAALTVPALIETHGEHVSEILLIVDCCRPPSSKFVNSDERFPAEVFNQRVTKIRNICKQINERYPQIVVTYLTPDNPMIDELSEKYTGNLVTRTHDCGACGFMSYLLGLHLASNRYVAHFDADMLLYQKEGYVWLRDAIAALEKDTSLLFCSPRTAPPTDNASVLTLHEMRPIEETQEGWINDWFSTRCFLVDTERMAEVLPLLTGFDYLVTLFKKIICTYFPTPTQMKRNSGFQGFLSYLYWRLYPVYPRSPEILFFRRFSRAGFRTLYLKSENACLMHPLQKDDDFIESLSSIMEKFQAGAFPEEQKGWADYKPEAWLV